MKRFALVTLALFGCRTEAAPEPRPDPQPAQTQNQTQTNGEAKGAGGGQGQMQAQQNGPRPVASVPVSPDDPVHGKFDLADATKGLSQGDKITATIDTSHGKLTCTLLADKAPITVANFVGLARGTRPWKDPATGHWVTRPAYDGTTFHRIIKGFMIQGGDAKGDGSGEPGYVIPDEMWGASHDHVGQLCMANRGPNTNGAQFFITEAAKPHLDSSYTIFGECEPEAVIHMIAGVPTGAQDRPTSPVTIRKVTITRGASGTPPFAGAHLDASSHD
jgi:peptidyl-prolyl cis-trans isomerase A (cyclophilin A)